MRSTHNAIAIDVLSAPVLVHLQSTFARVDHQAYTAFKPNLNNQIH